MSMDRDKMSNLYKGPSIDASYQVSVHLAEGFQRGRLKCEKLTNDKWWQKLTLPLARWAKNDCNYLNWKVLRLTWSNFQSTMLQVKNLLQLKEYEMFIIKVPWLTVIKLLSTSFVLVLEAQPIRTSYPLNTSFWLDDIEVRVKKLVLESFKTVRPEIQGFFCIEDETSIELKQRMNARNSRLIITFIGWSQNFPSCFNFLLNNRM